MGVANVLGFVNSSTRAEGPHGGASCVQMSKRNRFGRRLLIVERLFLGLASLSLGTALPWRAKRAASRTPRACGGLAGAARGGGGGRAPRRRRRLSAGLAPQCRWSPRTSFSQPRSRAAAALRCCLWQPRQSQRRAVAACSHSQPFARCTSKKTALATLDHLKNFRRLGPPTLAS